MKFGVCAPVERAQDLKRIGYDYIEPSLQAVASMEDDAFEAACGTLADSGLRAQAFNSFLGADYPVTGDAVEMDRLKAYVRGALARAKRLGGEIAVFGSAAARNVPEGFDRQSAYAQLIAFLRMAGDAANENGITIAVEPLRLGESNIINLVSEGARLARDVNHISVRSLADLYHVIDMQEAPDSLLCAADTLRHVHIARPGGREYPAMGDGAQEIYLKFMGALKQIGYDARISVEGGAGEDFQGSARAALALLRALWEKA